MIFVDPVFIFLFLPATVTLFYRLTTRFGARAGFIVLLIASLLFYCPWGFRNTIVLVASFTLNFACIYTLLVARDERERLRWLIHAAGQLYNFGSLFLFKYSIFLTGLQNVANGQHFSLINIAIPIGISFYTFQQAMFLLEAYQRTPGVLAYLDPERLHGWAGLARAYLRYAVFVTFFPHLVIGPIVYVEEFQPQVDHPDWGRLKRSNIEVGLVFLALGIFKKAVLADNLAPVVNSIFAVSDRSGNISTLAAWVGAAGYCAQLYFDFSGYADIALGAARLFGVRYPTNFDSPFKATGIAEYYQRWHITLTRVMARFVFLPLSMTGNRFAARRNWRGLPARLVGSWIPLLLNFELIAVWHGARLTFVVFGIIHGAWYVLETELRRLKLFGAPKNGTPGRLRAFVAHVVFLVPLATTFVLFRSNGVPRFLHYAWRMFSFHSGGGARVGAGDMLLLAFCFAIIWLLPNSIEFLRRYRPAIMTYRNPLRMEPFARFAWRPSWMWSIFVTALFVAGLYYLGQDAPFLYIGF